MNSFGGRYCSNLFVHRWTPWPLPPLRGTFSVVKPALKAIAVTIVEAQEQ